MHYGVSNRKIDAIASASSSSSRDEEVNLLCRVSDEISRRVRPSNEPRSPILGRCDVQGATELTLCVSYFYFLIRFLESTRVELERG